MKTTVTILIFILLTGFSSQILASSCIEQMTVEEELKQSDAVVVGIVLSKQFIVVTDSTMLKMYPNDTLVRNSLLSKKTIARYDLLVLDVYKGKFKNDTLTIYTGIGRGDCGFNFIVGSKYIVYARNYKVEGRHIEQLHIDQKSAFYTTICRRTRLFDTTEIKEIEKHLKKQNKKSDNESVIIVNPESPPVYKNGGEQGLRQFIIDNLKSPTGQFVEGRVYVGFTVDTFGNVKDVEIKLGITKETDEEAIRIVKMLTFIPGTFYGKPIEMKMVLPISFSIQKPKDQ